MIGVRLRCSSSRMAGLSQQALRRGRFTVGCTNSDASRRLRECYWAHWCFVMSEDRQLLELDLCHLASWRTLVSSQRTMQTHARAHETPEATGVRILGSTARDHLEVLEHATLSQVLGQA